MEFACKDVVFHFNKAHLTDSTIPMWVLKFHGETYYVNHVECNVPWSTKETPDNPHTKGSIKVKDCLLQIDDNNDAKLSQLTPEDKQRLKKEPKVPSRIIVSDTGNSAEKLRKALKDGKIKHGPITKFSSMCYASKHVTEIYSERDMTYLRLMLSDTDIRQLMPNESYYEMYSDPKYQGISDIDTDAIDWSLDDEDELVS
jgi:hypothetical protein